MILVDVARQRSALAPNASVAEQQMGMGGTGGMAGRRQKPRSPRSKL
jgi:hypothetical protein